MTSPSWQASEVSTAVAGACGGGSPAKEWEDRHDALGDEFKALVCADQEPGLLAYVGEEPVGWVAVAPRSEYPRLDRSPKLKPVDDQPVWSITCFYIHRDHRRQGVAQELLAAAVEYARSKGAEISRGLSDRPGGGEVGLQRQHLHRHPADVRSRRLSRSGAAGGRPIVRLALQ